MKRIAKLFFVIAAAVSTFAVSAQDTLIGPKPNYYFQYWFGGNYQPYDTVPGMFPSIWYGSRYFNSKDGDFCKYMHTDTILEIYGIAASLGSEYEPVSDPYADNFVSVDSSMVDDTSTTNVFEYLRLYALNKDGDSMIVVNQGRIHHKEDPFDHYLLWGQEGAWSQFSRYQRVYEVYFDSVSHILGDFGVGMSQINSVYDVERRRYHTWPIGIVTAEHTYLNHHPDTIYIEYEQGGQKVWTFALCGHYFYIFPILDHNCHVRPAEDTTHSGIREPVDLGTVVQPNPASESVRVVSAFGMTKVEAYNSAGVKMWEQTAGGNSATLDVRRWPAGNYILLVHTPQGIAHKPLVVSR